MSQAVGQLVFAVGGSALGSLGGPLGTQLGWAIGSAVGGSLFAEKGRAATLSDNKAQAVDYGTPLSRSYGTVVTSGQILWASDKRGVTTSSGGKGGPSVSTTTFYQDLLIQLDARPGFRVVRVFANGKVIYSVGPDATDDTLAASAGTEYWTELREYPGGAAQLPDPVYAAAVTNAPGYRWSSTCFIESFNLGPSGQEPILAFEIAENSTVGSAKCVEIDPGSLHLWLIEQNWDSIEGIQSALVAGWTASISAISGPSFIGGTIGTSAEVQGCRRYFELHIRDNTASAVEPSRWWVSDGAGNSWGMSYSGYKTDAAGTNNGHPSDSENPTDITPTDYGADPTILGVVIDSIDGVAWVGRKNPSDAAFYWSGDAASPSPVTGAGGMVTGLDGTDLRIHFRQATNNNAALSLDVLTTEEQFTYPVPTGCIPWASTGIVAPPPITPGAVTLDDVVADLCALGGLEAADIDVTALAAVEVTGYKIANPSQIRSALEQLAAAYYVQCTESDKVYFSLRGGSVAATINYADMIASDDPLKHERADATVIPRRWALSYTNASNDHQVGTVAENLLTGASSDARSAALPVVMEPAQAQGVVTSMARDALVSATTFGPSITRRTEPRLTPTDVVTLGDAAGNSYRARIVRMLTTPGARSLELVADDADALVSAGITADVWTPTVQVNRPGATEFYAFEAPILRDADDGFNVLVVAKRRSGTWPGAGVYKSTDDATFSLQGTIVNPGTFGYTTTALTDYTGGNVFDMVGSVTVDLGDGTASTYTRDQLLNDGAGFWMIGGELIQARKATLVSPGVYTLTELLRGRRGTEWAMTGHTINERAVFMQVAGTVRVGHQLSDVGGIRYFRGVTNGRAVTTATSQRLYTDWIINMTQRLTVGEFFGVSARPLAPVNIRRTLLAGGQIKFTWDRRSRFTGTSLSTPPLGEESERYLVTHWDAGLASNATTYETVLREHQQVFVTGDRFFVQQIGAGGFLGYAAEMKVGVPVT